MDECICRICGSDDIIKICDEVTQAPESCVYECGKCSTNFIHPIMSLEEEESFYARSFEDYMTKRSGTLWESADEHFYKKQAEGERRLKNVRKYINRNDSILEIGSSTGYFLDDLRGYAGNVTGIEPSDAFRQYANSQDIPTVSGINEIEGNKYDIILLYYVIEHLRDPIQYISALKGYLNKGGHILAEVPNVKDALYSLYNAKGFQQFYWQKAHYYNYSNKSLEYVINKAGFDVVTYPEQRYDLANHLNWLQNGTPGGNEHYKKHFSIELESSYSETLKRNWMCDTVFAIATDKNDTMR